MTAHGTLRAFSAPGKALFAGGYLVLDPAYCSYVTALSSRMHAIIRKVEEFKSDDITITVTSPQFEEGAWSYRVKKNAEQDIPKEVNGKKNPFLESTIVFIIAYLGIEQISSVHISIFSDSGYHSQANSVQQRSSNQNKEFNYHSEQIHRVPKTGMGSSAGLVTVVVTALFSAFQREFSVDEFKNRIHNCAQIAHCHAQNKIGSGFDVAAAVYGSIIYRRFNPSVINGVLHHEYLAGVKGLNRKEFEEILRSIIDSDWDFEKENCSLPPFVKLLMGDVKGGSETPKLVSKVLQWKESDPIESNQLFKDLNNSNLRFMDSLKALHRLYEKDPSLYRSSIKEMESDEGTTSASIHEAFRDLTVSIAMIRSNLCKLTALSHAQVEPPNQTKLLDACLHIEGCLGGVVPGAGGNDAICLLMIADEIPKFIQSTKKEKIFEQVNWLDLSEESCGVLEESVEDYEGLF